MNHKNKRIFYLDFIRVVSMIFVVIYHFNCALSTYSIQTKPIFIHYYANGDLGQIGVSLFFIISGAALMYTYQDDLQPVQYYKRRFYSIYPMFWLAFFVAFLYYFYVNLSINHSVPNWTFLLTIAGFDGYLSTLIPNFYLLGEWFLGCIILFYLIFPVLRKCMLRYPAILLSLSTLTYVILVMAYDFILPTDWSIFTRMPEFIFGMFIIYQHQRFQKHHKYYALLSLLLISLLFFKEFHIPQMYMITIMGISIFMFLTYIGQYIKKESLQAPFLILSQYSYAVFLVHHIIITQVTARFAGRAITWAEAYCLFFIVCFFIAVIGYSLKRVSDWLFFKKDKKRVSI